MAKLMIVDDSLFQRKNLRKMITQMGWEVIAEASNGREAVELYPDLKPDVVLMDLVMPEMEGVEAVERIMAMDRGARIVVISSIGYDDIVNRALNLGAKQFITKPVDFNLAVNAIRSVMEEI